MSTLTLKLLEETFAIHSLASDIEIPKAVFDAPIFFIAKTYEETSIVLPQSINIVSDEVEKDWQALEVVGPLDFTLTGILSKISTILANEKISIFAISTFDTDYILVKSNNVSLATTALISNDYQII
ncbi:amino acid-binding protein [Colwellia sp. PAMC 20917]|jgi:hypothetical protein|uniref:ACT domain-containing protein n=1 Tax=Colwellia sp. PAMC 20917 TaxID=1816218 RepID=UPI000878ABDC|nr:ACT domain-containing protein [Colwellia sp. PAMC 20917]AOW75789.1 amino acid-binding protein [Colwellia sp. PAMC 20917]